MYHIPLSKSLYQKQGEKTRRRLVKSAILLRRTFVFRLESPYDILFSGGDMTNRKKDSTVEIRCSMCYNARRMVDFFIRKKSYSGSISTQQSFYKCVIMLVRQWIFIKEKSCLQAFKDGKRGGCNVFG